MKSFYPQQPAPWNRISWVMKQGGYTHKKPFYWQIATVCDFKDIGEGINRYCRDLSKTHVEKCFIEAFGYGSFVDPSERSKKVVKSETQAAHDGRIVFEPYTLKEGEICQRYIETGLKELRVLVINRKAKAVMIKRKKGVFDTGAKSFNTFEPEILSRSTIDRINHFSELLQMDYGELDVLKDVNNGKFYIVDANQCPGGGTKEFFNQSPEELQLLIDAHKELFD